jgi:hypothetical protein
VRRELEVSSKRIRFVEVGKGPFASSQDSQPACLGGRAGRALRVRPGRHMASSNVEDLLRALEERASTARTIFMLLDSDADGLVAVEQVGRAAAKPEFLRGSGLTAWEHRQTRAPGHSRPSLGPCASLALLTHARATC